MRHYSFYCVLLMCAVSMTACKREEPAPIEPASQNAPIAAEPAPAVETMPQAIETTIAQSGVQQTTPSPGSRDPGPNIPAVVGTYVADGATLDIKADGTWQRQSSSASAQALVAETGTWTLEKDGKELLLDSDDKSVDDLRYSIVSKNALKPLAGGNDLTRQQ